MLWKHQKKSDSIDSASVLPDLPPIIVAEKRETKTIVQEELPSLKKTPKLIKLDVLKSNTKFAADNPVAQAETEVKIQKTRLALTAENVENVWLQITSETKESKARLSNMMMLFIPELTEGKIIIYVQSDLQLNTFSEQRETLEKLISDKIEGDFQIELKHETNESVKKKYFGPQEKFRRLMELNPAIAKFQKEMGLDFEY